MPHPDSSLIDLRYTRSKDPVTSRVAAERVTVDANLTTKAIVLGILRTWGPLTHDEIHARYKAAGGTRTPQRIRTATKELVTENLVRESTALIGETENGGPSLKWEIR